MSSNKKYWKSVEELKGNSSIVETLRNNEFVEEIPTDEFLGDKESLQSSSTTRRDFLKYVGFSTAAATLAACEGPVKKSIPYVVQPESIIPGVANYYATTIADGFDFASVLVKTREGRPIKIENNTLASTNGTANARVNASVLGLYDSLRVQGPMKGETQISWDDFDAEVVNTLNGLKDSGKDIVLLTQTYSSPSTSKLIAEFKEKYGNVRHVIYDAVSESAALDAFQAKYGERALANYDFSQAATIVSVGADFLGDWQGGGFDGDYAKGRIPKDGKMSRHIQFESNMSLTGANADKRVPVTPTQQKLVLAQLHSLIVGSAANSNNLPAEIKKTVQEVASELNIAGSNAVVVSGIQDINAQTVVFEINEALKSKAFDPKTPIKTRQGDSKQVAQLVADMKAGKVGALIMSGVNPMYTLPNAADFAEGLKNTFSVAFSMKVDETASLTNLVGAAPHYLESWGDVELKKGHYSLMQPTIRPLFNSRQFQEALLKWNDNDISYNEYLKTVWNEDILNGNSFNQALHDGVFVADTSSEIEVLEPSETPASNAAIALANSAKAVDGLELTLYTKTGMGDGQQANNPWLQEFPDPITRNTWDNYLTVSKADAESLGLENYLVSNGALDGSYANVTVNGTTLENVPVLIQPGQAKGTVGLAFGYGKTLGIQEEMQTGVNAYVLYDGFNPVQNVTIEKAAGTHKFASVQMKSTMDGRGDILRETSLLVFNTENSHHWNPVPEVSLDHQEIEASEATLWDEFDSSIGPHFNLSIDLNACTGCGACVIACHAENNVPVVGKDEVRKYRDMHWLRIDRYYSSEETFEGDNEYVEANPGSISTYHKLEDPSENPQVAFQPVMCQHCNHAPCETVCPVAATSHGRQGQNQMAYNRCVGTRYCANNCPYKVRRFNWFLYNNNDEFDYHMNNDLGRMVLNPDVVVRSRGVMEKCSMCIQMTQKTILDAKREGREIKDGELQTACSAACGTGAMVFGNVNDKDSEVVKLKQDKRMYHLLGFKGTRPNVFYHVKVRNTNEA